MLFPSNLSHSVKDNESQIHKSATPDAG